MHQNVRPIYKIKKKKLEEKDQIKKKEKKCIEALKIILKILENISLNNKDKIEKLVYLSSKIRQLIPAILNAYANFDKFVEKLHITECEAPVQKWVQEEVLESLPENGVKEEQNKHLIIVKN
ncbi:3217_t:CDS:2 [Cetraspora pellucida]|uniref:3217_t:CDS:1 n=1 Tax=Cetraspora pellucida TaxID=1433469 RepID=A0A9N9NGF3_9GLOM|nr:3217_t:CDS:2 [Cetraspora pellucida]